ncbi:MAG: Nif3-like dinuclear metal center hexameric protein [Saprospiraceae bacterium]
MPLIKEIIQSLENIAPPIYQESYDNSGLLVGNPGNEVTAVLISLDCLEKTVDEAIEKSCNLIVAHHPIVFKGLKRFNGKNYVERTIMKAIKHDIAIYAIHTNLDNMYFQGVNAKIAEMLHLKNTKILAPKKQILRNLVTFVPNDKADLVRAALFQAGAGRIGNYDQCSFNVEGTGTFRANEQANPYVGIAGVQHRENETRVEVVFPMDKERELMQALCSSHPYEEVAYYIYSLENQHQEIGSGMIGNVESAMDMKDFLQFVKQQMKCAVVKYTDFQEGKKVRKVALCGGSGSFLLNDAIAQGADVYISADFKYHEYFDADDKIVIADIGHFESEQYTISLISDIISKNFLNFAVYLTERNTNPVNYL